MDSGSNFENEIKQQYYSNGKLLSQYQNKPVIITGVVSNINSNGQSFDIRTVDNMTVKVNLKSPLDDMLDGYVEIRGISQGTSVLAENIIQFRPQQDQPFDVHGHDQLCQLLNSINQDDIFQAKQAGINT